MGRTSRAHRAGGWEQLELLGPQPRWPLWGSLPVQVSRELTRLLAQMLREAAANTAQQSGAREQEMDDD